MTTSNTSQDEQQESLRDEEQQPTVDEANTTMSCITQSQVESWLENNQAFYSNFLDIKLKAALQALGCSPESHTNELNPKRSSENVLPPVTVSQVSTSTNMDLIQLSDNDAEPIKVQQERQSSPCVANKDSNSLQVTSQERSGGPTRKISATDFESRTGSGFLRRMVETTPDGRPTFLIRSADGEAQQEKQTDVVELSDPNNELISIESELAEGSKSQPTVDEKEDQSEKNLEQDSEVDLIFGFVTNIYGDLDIRTLLHTMLKYIAMIVNADKSSLFLVRGEPGDPNRHLVSQLFDVTQNSEVSSETSQSYTIPWGKGLIGHVAKSGVPVNIPNCYEDPRFTSSIDKQTGYVTRHMLCAPIFDKKQQVIGVAQVINKRDGNPFSEKDQFKFIRYLQLCGIGLCNAQLYEHCLLENRRNQVLLDLARIIFEEQSIQNLVYKIMLNTQSLLECQRCQVLLLDEDDNENLDGLLPSNSELIQKCRPNGAANNYTQLHSKPIPLNGCTPNGLASNDVHSDKQQNNNQSSSETELKLEPTASSASPIFYREFHMECQDEALVYWIDKIRGKIVSLIDPSGKRSLKKEMHLPINIGITGYVAMTGKTVNIPDAHLCDRFDKRVDELSDFKHKSILCMPILNGRRQIIGVSQLINKRNGQPFNKNDEDLFEAFAIFCGLGINNTLMYEKVLKIMNKQRVTFDVLSYHATAPLEDARKLHLLPVPTNDALDSLEFDDFELSEQTMLRYCLRFFLDLNLIRRFQIDRLTFCNWILSVQKNYRNETYHPIVGGNGLRSLPVKYHNWRHAFNVSRMMFAILTTTELADKLGDLEILALMIACLCHDLDHRGTTNSFQVKSASPLAQLYSTSTMEHHHLDQCIMILNSPGNQILSNLTPEEYRRVILLLKEAIIATDLAKYFEKRDSFFNLVQSGQFDWTNNQEHRTQLRCMLMTACDVAAITKPWDIQRKVAELVMSEFYQQGDIEKSELHIEPNDMMNREKEDQLPGMQMNFIDEICEPIYVALADLFPKQFGTLLLGCRANRSQWSKL